MKILIHGGRIVCPASGRDEVADIAVASGRIVAIGKGADFTPDRVLNATGLVVAPGLVDLAARLREPGQEHEGMLESELAAAAAGGVTSLVCPPDTDPVLDEPGLVEMLKFRARKLSRCRVFPLGALTRGLEGAALAARADTRQAAHGRRHPGDGRSCRDPRGSGYDHPGGDAVRGHRAHTALHELRHGADPLRHGAGQAHQPGGGSGAGAPQPWRTGYWAQGRGPIGNT